MRFVGCALAWRPGEAREKVSCLVVMDERGSIIANSFVADAEKIAGTVESYGSERRGTVLGVDAPLAVPNERGTRQIERILSKVALPAYSASRRMFDGEPYSEELLAELENIGIEATDYPFPRERGQSVVVEVDSAATLKVLSLERSGAADNGELAKRLRAMDDPKLRKGKDKHDRAACKKTWHDQRERNSPELPQASAAKILRGLFHRRVDVGESGRKVQIENRVEM